MGIIAELEKPEPESQAQRTVKQEVFYGSDLDDPERAKAPLPGTDDERPELDPDYSWKDKFRKVWE